MPSTDEPAGIHAVPEVERMDRVLDGEHPMIEMPAEPKGGLARPDLLEKLSCVIDGIGRAHVLEESMRVLERVWGRRWVGCRLLVRF